LSTHAVTNCLT